MPVVVEVEAVPRHPDDRLARRPTCQPRSRHRHLALGGEHHVAVPLPGVAGVAPGRSTSCRSRPASAPSARAWRGARRRRGPPSKGYDVTVSRSARPAARRDLAGHVGRAVVGPVVDEQHVVAARSSGGSTNGSDGRLVLDPQHRGRARAAAAGPGPGPDDVEVVVALEVAQAGPAPTGPSPARGRAILPQPDGADRGRATDVRDPVGTPVRRRRAGAAPGRSTVPRRRARAWRPRRRPRTARSPRPPRRGRRRPRGAGRGSACASAVSPPGSASLLSSVPGLGGQLVQPRRQRRGRRGWRCTRRRLGSMKRCTVADLPRCCACEHVLQVERSPTCMGRPDPVVEQVGVPHEDRGRRRRRTRGWPARCAAAC